MKLVIFDIDGTLTQTSRVDEICFTRAFSDAHGLEVVADHWVDCPHVSDSGITQHLFQYYFGRDPHDHESSAIKQCLVNLLEEHHRFDRSYFAEIPRAAETFNQLVESRGWAKHVIPDFEDADRFFECLEEGEAPDAEC